MVKSILLTGHTGFLGSVIYQKLEKEFKSRTDGLQKKVKAIQKQEKDFDKKESCKEGRKN